MNRTVNPSEFLSGLPQHAKQGWPWVCEESSFKGGRQQFPKITLVTPSYNQAAYLEETIRSVILQQYPNLEYIVIDGGSSDGSVEIIKKYEKWISYWVSEEDRGQAQAINKGFSKGSGEIMGWINSDDLLAPKALFKVADYFQNNAECQWVIGACDVTNVNLRFREKRLAPPSVDSQYFLQFPIQWFAQQSTFWRRSLWAQVGALDESFHYAMDMELWIRMAKETEPDRLDDVLSLYRMHDEAKCQDAKQVPKVLEESQRALLLHYPDDSDAQSDLPRHWARQIEAMRAAAEKRKTSADAFQKAKRWIYQRVFGERRSE